MGHQEAEAAYCNVNFIYQLENSIFSGLYYELVKRHQLLGIFWNSADGFDNLLILLTDPGQEKRTFSDITT